MPKSAKIERVFVGEAELFDGSEERTFLVIPENRHMKGGGVVVAVKVFDREERDLEDPKRVKVGDCLFGPEFVVLDPAHDLIADRSWRIGFAGCVHVSGDDDRILVQLYFIEKSGHLFAAASRRAFIFQMRSDDGCVAGRQIRDGNLGDQGHSTTMADFTLDPFPEQCLGGPSTPDFEFRSCLHFLRVPVIANWQSEDARVANGISAQDGCAMQTMVATEDKQATANCFKECRSGMVGIGGDF